MQHAGLNSPAPPPHTQKRRRRVSCEALYSVKENDTILSFCPRGMMIPWREFELRHLLPQFGGFPQNRQPGIRNPPQEPSRVRVCVCVRVRVSVRARVRVRASARARARRCKPTKPQAQPSLHFPLKHHGSLPIGSPPIGNQQVRFETTQKGKSTPGGV